MTKALVFGATGFLGRHFCTLLAAEGIDLLTSSRTPPTDRALPWLGADIRDAAAVGEVLAVARPDIVVQLVTPARHAPLNELIAVNVLGTDTLLGAVAAKASRARVLIVGSSAEYGVIDETELPITEDVLPRPVSDYGLSKLMQSYLGLSRAQTKGLALVHARVFNVTGPGESADQVVGAVARQLVQAEQGLGDGALRVRRLDTIRDYLDVRDVARALWALAMSPDARGIVNVCSGVGVAIQTVVEKLLEASSADVQIQLPPQAPSSAIDVPVQVGNPSYLSALTGFMPRIPLSESLSDTLDECRATTSAEVVSAVGC